MSAHFSDAAPLRVRGIASALRGPFDLDVAAGEIVGIAGPSGSGKSLLLRMIADLDPNTGSVALGATSRAAVPAPSWRRAVTYVAAEPAFWADTVAEHFASEDALRALLPEVGLGPSIATATIARLSTGERLRVALLRALVQSPRFLLLDEPTSGLDGATALVVEAVLRARADRGVGIVVVSHDAAQLARLASRQLRMSSEGQLE